MFEELMHRVRGCTPLGAPLFRFLSQHPRLAPALFAGCLCLFAAACSDDDSQPVTRTSDQAQGQLVAAPVANAVATAALTIQTPAKPLLQPDAAASATATAAAPLAEPVIHTVD